MRLSGSAARPNGEARERRRPPKAPSCCSTGKNLDAWTTGRTLEGVDGAIEVDSSIPHPRCRIPTKEMFRRCTAACRVLAAAYGGQNGSGARQQRHVPARPL